MRRVDVYGLLCVLLLVFTGPASADSRQSLRPITASCVMDAASRHGVPLAALIAILAVEGGEVGMIRRNTNGSFDLGPGQINTIWLSEIRAAGVDPLDVLYDGCVNIDFAARILARQFDLAADAIDAIGRYHSNTPSYKATYQRKIMAALQSDLSVERLIDRANRPVPRQSAEQATVAMSGP